MANIYSLKSGLASDATVWSGGVVPVSGDRVLIDTGHVVEVDGTYTWGDDSTATITINGKSTTASITYFGTLKASRSVSSLLICRGNLSPAVGGILDYGVESDFIPLGVIAEIRGNFSTTMAHNKYGILTNSIDFAKISFWGADKTPRTALTAAALAGDTVVTVADATNWQVGDYLAFGVTTTGTHTSITYRVISAIAGLNITLSGSLGAASQIGRTVLNLTRNVKVTSHLPQTWRASPCSIRVANIPTYLDAIEIGNTEFVGIGGISDVYRRGALCLTWSYAFTNLKSVKRIYRPVCHDIASISGSTVTKLATTANDTGLLYIYQAFAAAFTIEEPVVTSSNYINCITTLSQPTVTITNAHVLGTRRTISTDFNSGLTINGGHYEGTQESPINQSVVAMTYNNTTFNSLGEVLRSPRIIGSLVFNSCNIGGTRGMINTPSAQFMENGQSVKMYFNNCIFAPSFTLPRTINFGISSDDTILQIRSKNNDLNIQEIYRKGGKISKDVTTIYRGRSSLSMNSWYSGIPLLHTTSVTVAPSETIRIRGAVRYNAAYTGSTPPKLTISGLGITPVVFTCPSVTDTWHDIDITVTNPQTYVGQFTLEFYAMSTANNETNFAWFDGFVLPDFVEWTRKYGDAFNPTSLISVADPLITLSEGAAAALTGLSYAAGTLTITENHSISEVYDWMNWYECSNRLAPIITSSDGVNYNFAGDIVLNGGNLTGSGALNLGAGILTVTGSETTSLPITYDSGTAVRTNISINGLVAGSRVYVRNDTDTANLYNDVMAGTSLALPITWTADKTLTVRAQYTSGMTSYLPYEAQSVLSASGASFLVNQIVDAVYITNAINGSTVTEFVADYPNVQVDVSDPDGVTTAQRLYAWFRYNEFSASGIEFFQGGMVADDLVNYQIKTGIIDLSLDNTSALPVIIAGARIYRDDDLSIIYSGSGSIQVDPSKAYIATGTLVDANIKYVNGVEVTGTGVEGDTWGPA